MVGFSTFYCEMRWRMQEMELSILALLLRIRYSRKAISEVSSESFYSVLCLRL